MASIGVNDCLTSKAECRIVDSWPLRAEVLNLAVALTRVAENGQTYSNVNFNQDL